MNGELADAAACYALTDEAQLFRNDALEDGQTVEVPVDWPFAAEWWKPKADEGKDRKA